MKHLLRNTLATAGLSIDRFADDRRIRDLISRLRPVTTDKALIRLGGDGDGGYLVPDDLTGLVGCFSPGVDVTASFEEALVQRGVPCYLADASVEAPPIANPLIHFDKKFIGVVNDEKTITLDTWIDKNAPDQGDLILQMDIEGAEWAALLNVSEKTLSRFRIVIVEFHDLDHLVSRHGFQFMSQAFDRLLQFFEVVHIHPNNIAPPLKKGDTLIPRLMEFTFLRKDRMTSKAYAKTFPHPLDRRNLSDRPDVELPALWYRG